MTDRHAEKAQEIWDAAVDRDSPRNMRENTEIALRNAEAQGLERAAEIATSHAMAASETLHRHGSEMSPLDREGYAAAQVEATEIADAITQEAAKVREGDR